MPDSFQQACQFFNIEAEKFNRIHTKGLKLKHLRYLYMRKEFEIVLSNLANNNSESVRIEVEQAKALHDALLNSSLITQHIDKYSASSVGLLELDTRSYSIQSIAESSQNSTSMSESVISIAPKTSGVEPGFKAFEVEDVMLYVWNKFPGEKHEIDRLAFIKSYAADAKKIYNAHEAEINAHFVKLTYTDITANNKLKPKLEDLQRTNTIKTIQKKFGPAATLATYGFQFIKTRSSIKINAEAALEVLANDIARVAGMNVQEQYLYRGIYPNGAVQFKLKAIYLRDVRELGPLKGGLKSDNGNYCYRQTVFDSNIYLSDHSIKNLAENLALLIVIRDRDAIGFKGQNKMRTKDKFIGIDFGHAYTEEEPLPVQYNFSFKEQRFKNYSVFYDMPRSSIVRGLLRLAQLQGENIPDAVLKSYGQDFYTEIKNIQPHSDKMIFTDYLNKFAELANEFTGNTPCERENKRCLSEMYETVKLAEKRHIRNKNSLIEQFRSYLKVEKNVIDIAENIEKIFCGQKNTSLHSPDGSVLLKHLRIIKSNICNLEFFTNNDDEYQIQFIFKNGTEAANGLKELNTWLQNYSATNMKINLKDQFLMITFKKDELVNINKILSEETIKEKFHPLDNKLFHKYQLELEIQDLLQQLSSHEMCFNFTRHTNKSGYQLTFKVEQKLLFQSLVSDFEQIFNCNLLPDNTCCVEFSVDELNEVYKILLAIPTKYKRELTIQKHSEDIYNTIAWIQKKVEQIHLFSFIRQGDNFTLIIRGNKMFRAIFLHALHFLNITNETCHFSYEQLVEVNLALITAYTNYLNVIENIDQTAKSETQTLKEVLDIQTQLSVQSVKDCIELFYEDKDIKNNVILVFDYTNNNFFIFKIIDDSNHPFGTQLKKRLDLQTFKINESGEYLIPAEKIDQLKNTLLECYTEYCQIDLNNNNNLLTSELDQEGQSSPSMRF